ncbi:MAG: hypothetical protein US75_C0001G0105 [Candidatus Woesebacteria bacterium GW2011_GWC1_38_13]|uniref:Uncharacterized protein n=3 Tax=Candidatus Woeseibacteriota TaxID=1752722 RepID=A0A0G0KWS1_9BACT|nr:MAG: hypothetical protein US67_C0007G0016 [Candidatus Woesebacteria bacterium GW2011_GWD1_38_10]KKQ57048.1 MAG: hypothetical protein US75_C0001G0105 [Candidatus Woesebacteria bacterium GW2011_GWC1_38_13]KKQ84108.1 MAG: hypothetical protein UT06_C0010G0014 [Candidatus Woesebacteria bacterium GW2011_GWA1_38_8]
MGKFRVGGVFISNIRETFNNCQKCVNNGAFYSQDYFSFSIYITLNMRRERDNDEQFSKKDLEIFRSLRAGKDLDRIFDRADLEGYEYRLSDLNRLRNFAEELGFEDLLEVIPEVSYLSRSNITKKISEAQNKFGSEKLSRRMGLERFSFWDKEMAFKDTGDARMEYIRKICFALGLSLKELMSDE